MAKVSAKDAIVLVNGYRLSSSFTQFDALAGVEPVEVTGFTEQSHNFIPGLFNSHISVAGLWDNVAGGVNDALKGLSSNKIVTILPEGYPAVGAGSLSLPYMQENFNPAGSPNTAVTLGSIGFSTYGSNNGLEYGVALQHGSITTTTTGTGVLDSTNAAVTAACAGSLHVWGITATDTYVIKIQHSTTLGSGYADLITFTLNGTALNSERIAVVSGTINKYRRVLATRTGAAGDTLSFTVHFWHA